MITPAIQRKRWPRQGMVLFEVIIALTIFALVAFALVTARSGRQRPDSTSTVLSAV